ncbi:MAG: cupin domain-containing protein [Gammaproteobacteria bacterium]|nr:cupin domain-containing protein [Gammaproteobacteria bacterium]
MSELLVEHNPSPLKLEVLGVDDWPVRTENVSTFSARYETTEVSFVTAGEAIITTQSGESILVREGDIITCMPGLNCSWAIKEMLTRHYRVA